MILRRGDTCARTNLDNGELIAKYSETHFRMFFYQSFIEHNVIILEYVYHV